MKNKISVILTFLLFAAIVALMGYAIIRIVVKPQRPLTNADIPQTTKDWFRDLLAGGSDIGGILGPDFRDPSEWGNYEDVDSMLRIEDEYFVIFYSSKDSAVQRKKAQICQRYAHDIIPKADLFMKGYPYPSKLNGRKLPIYLGRNISHYKDISNQVAGYTPRRGTLGFFSFEYGIDGIYAKGILISPETWSVPDLLIDEQTEDMDFRATLWHEMNHFIYFTKWDFTQPERPSLWFTEGLAEYFSDFRKRLLAVGNHSKYDLRKDYCNGNDEYWVGYTAFLCLEKNYNVSLVSDVVAQSYDKSIDKALQTVIQNGSLESWNNQWHSYMEKKEYNH